MTPADSYRVKAAQLRARARHEFDHWVREQFESLAQQYLRLAQQADKNQLTDVGYEPPPSQ